MKSDLHTLYVTYINGSPFQTQIADYPGIFQTVFSERKLAEECFEHPSVKSFLAANERNMTVAFVRVDDPEQFVRDCLKRGVRVVMDIKFTGETTAQWTEVVEQEGDLFNIDTRPA